MHYLIFFMLSCSALGFDPGQYAHKKILWNSNTSGPIYTVHWRIVSKTINLALVVKTTGWVGFGIAEQSSGTMGGSDIVQGYVTTDGVKIQDSYALSQLPGSYFFTAPKVDACNDWTLIKGEETGGNTILELSRLIDTGDAQDRPFLLDKVTKIIIAFGKEDSFGSQHLKEDRKATIIDLTGAPSTDPLKTLKMDNDVKTFEIKTNWVITTNATDVKNYHYPLPSGNDAQYIIRSATKASMVDEVTVYYDMYFNATSFLSGGDYHIVGIEPLISDASMEYLHHFVLDASNGISDFETIYPWAPGGTPMLLDKCGFRGSLMPYFQLNVHYNNAAKKTGYNDQSGIRIYYTRKMKPVDCGLMNLGDAPVALSRKNPHLPLGKSEYSFTCPSVSNWIIDENTTYPVGWGNVANITVFKSVLHMHYVGRQTWTEHWRDGKLLQIPDRINFWDSNFEGSTDFSEGEFVIKPNDQLVTKCIYETSKIDHKFGLATWDEMCINFVLYYPRIAQMSRRCSYSDGPTDVRVSINRLDDFSRTFGKAHRVDACPNANTKSPTKSPTASKAGMMQPLNIFTFFLSFGIFTNIAI